MTGGSGSSRVSRTTEARASSASSSHGYHHHPKSSGDLRSLSPSSSRASAERKSLPGHQHERRRESAERSGSSCLQTGSIAVPVTQAPEKRTVTVISSLVQPDHVEEPTLEVDNPASVTGPPEVVDGPATDCPASDGTASDGLASDGLAGDNQASDGPSDDGPAYDGSAGDGSARDDEPVIVDGPEEVADPARQPAALQDDDPAGVAGPAPSDPATLGTPAGNTPSAVRDSSILTGVSSPLFPSMPTAINQATLIDFMSMWTLLQRWIDQGMAVSDAQARPAAQSTVPAPRDDTHPGGPTLHLGIQIDDPGR